MFEVLPASRGDLVHGPPFAGAILSTAAHAAIVGLYVAGLHLPAVRRLAEFLAAEREKPEFIIPPNRGTPRPLESIQFLALGEGEAEFGVARAQKTIAPRAEFTLAEIKGSREQVQSLSIVVPESTLPDNAYSVLDVDSAAVRDPSSAAPAYPPVMMAKGIEGSATMRFVIDSTGLIDPGTVTLLNATHAEFVQAVREAMPRMRFRPAKMGLIAVRQLAEQMFRFEIKRVAVTETTTPKRP